MADPPQTRPSFWTTLPGILTGLGGLIVATTGLITALYTTGVIGPRPESNYTPPSNSAATFASVPEPSPSATPTPNPENDRYRSLAGKWEVKAKGTCFPGLKETAWQLDATAAGNVVTFRGRIFSLDGNRNLDEETDEIEAAFIFTMVGAAGIGDLKETDAGGVSVSYPATIRLDDVQTRFRGTVGQPACTVTGRKI